MAAAPTVRHPVATERAVAIPQPARLAGRARSAHRGRLVAVCGVTPGAGATLLSCLLALAAARHSDEDVLVCDVSGLGAAVAGPRGLTAVGSLLAPHVRGAEANPDPGDADPPVAARRSSPRDEPTRLPAGLRRLLHRACATHVLTVVDVGTLRRPVERLTLPRADAVVWILPATADGLAAAPRTLRRLRRGPRELVVARAGEPGPSPPRWRGRALRPPGPVAPAPALEALRMLADARGASLILSPWLSPRTAARTERALETLQVPLQALVGALSR
jgi:hypothetical protein